MLTMAVLTLPVVIVSVEEALRAVPQAYRDASAALGATRTQTIFRVVLPNALSGVLTGTILAVGRGAGEVAPILFVGAAYFLPHLPTQLNDQFMQALIGLVAQVDEASAQGNPEAKALSEKLSNVYKTALKFSMKQNMG